MVGRRRHIAKAITWRMLGTLDTVLIGWFFTGSLVIGAAIGGAEVITKTFLYYMHERAWYNYIPYGLEKDVDK